MTPYKASPISKTKGNLERIYPLGVVRARKLPIVLIRHDGPRVHNLFADSYPPRWLNLAGFSLAFAMRGKLWTGRFKSMLLGATDSVGRENRAAQRRSHRL